MNNWPGQENLRGQRRRWAAKSAGNRLKDGVGANEQRNQGAGYVEDGHHNNKDQRQREHEQDQQHPEQNADVIQVELRLI